MNHSVAHGVQQRDLEEMPWIQCGVAHEINHDSLHYPTLCIVAWPFFMARLRCGKGKDVPMVLTVDG